MQSQIVSGQITSILQKIKPGKCKWIQNKIKGIQFKNEKCNGYCFKNYLIDVIFNSSNLKGELKEEYINKLSIHITNCNFKSVINVPWYHNEFKFDILSYTFKLTFTSNILNNDIVCKSDFKCLTISDLTSDIILYNSEQSKIFIVKNIIENIHSLIDYNSITHNDFVNSSIFQDFKYCFNSSIQNKISQKWFFENDVKKHFCVKCEKKCKDKDLSKIINLIRSSDENEFNQFKIIIDNFDADYNNCDNFDTFLQTILNDSNIIDCSFKMVNRDINENKYEYGDNSEINFIYQNILHFTYKNTKSKLTCTVGCKGSAIKKKCKLISDNNSVNNIIDNLKQKKIDILIKILSESYFGMHLYEIKRLFNIKLIC